MALKATRVILAPNTHQMECVSMADEYVKYAIVYHPQLQSPLTNIIVVVVVADVIVVVVTAPQSKRILPFVLQDFRVFFFLLSFRCLLKSFDSLDSLANRMLIIVTNQMSFTIVDTTFM